MISIKPNREWVKFEKLFKKNILKRYEWFLWEFGHRLTLNVNDYLLGKIPEMLGGVEYKKRLVVAEIRDKKMKVWWAIAARAADLAELDLDPTITLFTVQPRLKVKNDPVREILVEFGPWTLETIPWVPTLRQGAVIAKRATEKAVKAMYVENKRSWKEIVSLMEEHQIDVMPRQMVRSRMKAVTDLEVQAMRQEFGMSEDSRAHWRPAIRWAKTEGTKELMSDVDLIKSMTDPSFQKWKKKGHAKDHMTEAEVKALHDFQEKVRV